MARIMVSAGSLTVLQGATIPTLPPIQSSTGQTELPLKQLSYVNKSNQFDLRGFFLNLVRSISHHPSTVTVDEVRLTDIHRLSICVDEDDFGMFAQSDGRSFQALQTILKAVVRRENMLATIEIVNRSSGSRLN